MEKCSEIKNIYGFVNKWFGHLVRGLGRKRLEKVAGQQQSTVFSHWKSEVIHCLRQMQHP